MPHLIERAHMHPRTCRKCGELKPFDQFKRAGGKSADGESYRLHICKPCANQQQRTAYHADPVARARQIVMSLNASKRNNGQRVDVDAAVKMLLDATHCTYCGQPNDGKIPFALDHMQPLALGGAHRLDNLTPCCEPCNRAKHDMPAAAYIAWLKGVVSRNAG